MIKRLLALTLLLLTPVIIAFCAYAGWFAYVWGFNPLMLMPLYVVCAGVAALLVLVAVKWGLRR